MTWEDGWIHEGSGVPARPAEVKAQEERPQMLGRMMQSLVAMLHDPVKRGETGCQGPQTTGRTGIEAGIVRRSTTPGRYRSGR